MTKKSNPQTRWRFPRQGWRVLGFRIFLLTAMIVVVVLGWLGLELYARMNSPQGDPTLYALATALGYTATPSITSTIVSPSATFTIAPTRSTSVGSLIFSARKTGRTHIWGYVPGDTSPVQLTFGEWEDRYPAVSPDGAFVAFSSNRDGVWDLYLLKLSSGDVQRLTMTPGYEGASTWSPDGMWIACEAYYGEDFNIWIIPVNGEQSPIQLTSHPAADISPSWDPKGRRIAFISFRDGNPDLFVADLENPDHRFINLTNTPNLAEMDPVFSPDGSNLAYAARSDSLEQIMIKTLEDPSRAPIQVGQGRATAWSPDGQGIAAVRMNPNESFLQTYSLGDGALTSLGFPLLEGIEDLEWMEHGIPGEYYGSELARATPSPQYLVSSQSLESGRFSLIDLPGISAPYPALSDTADEAFNALRSRASAEIGWDFLASLENAFVGVNDPLPPGYAYNDWLYTGRAFAFNRAAVQAGWVELIREDFGGETYWRVFLRTNLQDGSLGEPLRYLPWDFGARHNGEPHAYDKGGSIQSNIPPGYYVDFTQLAADYGFQRVPALANWRTFYPSARYNEFVLTDGLDWFGAMLEIYPASAIITPTPFRTPTPTPTQTPRPTATPWWWRWRTPTPIPP